MRKILSYNLAGIVISLTLTYTALSQESYFPKNTFSSNSNSDKFASQWYSRVLRVLDEPSLYTMAKTKSAESYRFLWLRTFHHPVAVRVDLMSDGSAVVTAKIASGAAGFNPGVLTVQTSRTLAADEFDKLRTKISASGYWSLPSHMNDQRGMDESEWIIEGVRHGSYHLVTRWSPECGVIRALGLTFAFDLAHLSIPADEIY